MLQNGISAPGESRRAGRSVALNSVFWFYPCSSQMVQTDKRHRLVNGHVTLL